MSTTKFFKMIAISAALCGGCSDQAGPDSDTATLEQKGGGYWVPNGPDLVHGQLSGRLIQGFRLVRNRPAAIVDEKGVNQYAITDTSYTDTTAHTYSVTSMPMTQGWFRFSYGNGLVAEKFAARSLTFNFNALDPSGSTLVPYTLFIKDIASPGSGAPEYGMHFMYYTYLQTDGTQSPAQSLCLDKEGKPEAVVPVRGRYWNLIDGSAAPDENMVSLACQSAAVAGCMEYGYNPWQSQTECLNPTNPASCHAANMWTIHQVCTRLKRADYCGTGQAHTMSGAMIHVFDWLAPPINDSGPDGFKSLEAVWGVSGVSCVNVPNLRHKELVDQDPVCADRLYNHTPSCVPERLGQNILGDLVESGDK